VNYPAAELRGIKNQKQDVPDIDTSFIEFTLLPLDHKARIFSTLSRLRRGCFHPHMGYLTDYSEVLNLLIQDFFPLIDRVYLVLNLSEIHIYVKFRVDSF